MRRSGHALALGLLLFTAGCSIDLPVDPADLVPPLGDALRDAERAVQDALADPLSAKPFPVLIGGDDERLFYATNLSDLRINFPGPTNDLVIPGFFGPSNLYRHRQGERELIRPLLRGSTFFGLATDGRFVGFISVVNDPETPFEVRTTEIASGQADAVVYPSQSNEGLRLVPTRLALDRGRLVFALRDEAMGATLLRVRDLTGDQPVADIETKGVQRFALRGNDLAYVEQVDEGAWRIVLRDLTAGGITVLAPNVRAASWEPVDVMFTPNRVLWNEPIGDGLSRLFMHDLPAGQTHVFAETAIGRLAGGDDDHVVMEEYVANSQNEPDSIVIRRYDSDRTDRKLAVFRADGLAGQTVVVGHRAAWVNPARRILIAPFDGEDRIRFEPF